MNGECGIGGVGETRLSREVVKTSNFGSRTVVRLARPAYPASLIRLFGLSCLFGCMRLSDEPNQANRQNKPNQTTKQAGLVSDLKVLPSGHPPYFSESGLHDGRSQARSWELCYDKCSYRIRASVLDAMSAGCVSGESQVFLLCSW
jgi:hypothetical protein